MVTVSSNSVAFDFNLCTKDYQNTYLHNKIYNLFTNLCYELQSMWPHSIINPVRPGVLVDYVSLRGGVFHTPGLIHLSVNLEC